MHELVEQLFSYLKATWRYRWLAVVVAWLIATAGWIVVDRIPNQYRSWARIYVDTQSILKSLMTGIAVDPNTAQLLAAVSRTLLSRPNLDQVIQMAGLEENLKSDDDREKLLRDLSSKIRIRSTRNQNLYTISYEGRPPQQAKRVVESLLTLFLQESLGDKRIDSAEAQKFIDDQLRNYGEKLMAAEKAVMEFKRQNVLRMPGEGRDYYAKLRDATDALRQASLGLREAENSREAIRQQLASYRDMDSVPGDYEGINPKLDARINALEMRLDLLLVTYTDQHPDVVALNRLISHFKEQRTAEAKLMIGTRGRPLNLGHQQLFVSLSSAEANVAAMRARVAQRERRYNELKVVADDLPKVEAEFTQLTRDYNVMRARYNKLLERRESAQISGEIDEKTNSMGFRVVDPARLPLSPSSPDRPRLVSMVLLAALGGGFGIAFLMGQLRPTFADERRLRELSGLPVLGTVVMRWTNAQKARQKRGVVAVLFSVASLLSAYAAIMVSLMLAASRV